MALRSNRYLDKIYRESQLYNDQQQQSLGSRFDLGDVDPDDLYGASTISENITQQVGDGESRILGTFWDHLVNSASMGLVGEYEDWGKKTTGERISAGLAEAVGMFVPMGLIGKGVRATKAAFGLGSVAKARRNINALNKMKTGRNQVFRSAREKAAGIKALRGTMTRYTSRDAFSGRRYMYQYEMGEEYVKQASRSLRELTQARMMKGLIKAGASKGSAAKQAKAAFDVIDDGLKAGKTINSISGWGFNAMSKVFSRFGANGKKAAWLAKYSGEVAQDMAVLGIHGVGMNYIKSVRRPDEMYTDPETGELKQVNEFKPWNALGHSMILSAAFPLVRSIKGGGEMRISEVWNAAIKGVSKTNYKKVAQGPNGAENIQNLLRIITGGKRLNLFGKSKFKSKISGKEYNIADIRAGAYNLKDKDVMADVVNIMEQMQKSFGRLSRAKIWGKAYMNDTMNKGTLKRMVLGGAAMNIDFLNIGDSFEQLRGMPAGELTSHFITGALMSRGRGGWAHDPQFRTPGSHSEQVADMYRTMSYLGIDHSNVSNYLRVNTIRDAVGKDLLGVPNDPVAKQVREAFDRIEKDGKIGLRNQERSKNEANDKVAEWKELADNLRLLEQGENFQPINLKLYEAAERNDLRSQLESIKYGEKRLTDVSLNEYMTDVLQKQVGRGGTLETMHKEYLEALTKESSPGADDAVINGYWSNTTNKFNHGGIKPEQNSQYGYDLHMMLAHMKKAGIVEEKGLGMVDLSGKANKARHDRLAELTEQFKRKLVNQGMGPDNDINFMLGNRETNPFLDTYLNGRMLEGQKRLGDAIIGKASQENIKDAETLNKIRSAIADDDGRLVNPNMIQIVDKDTRKPVENRGELYEKVENIAEILYIGADQTKQKPSNRMKEIDVETAERIVAGYEGMQVGIRPENLREHGDYLRMRSMEKFGDLNPNTIRTITHLEENNLLARNEMAGRFEISSEPAIREMARERGLNPEEFSKIYNEILETLPRDRVEIVDGMLDLGFDKPHNIEGLRTAWKLIPEIYNKQVIKDVQALRETNVGEFAKELTESNLDKLERNLKEGRYQDATTALEEVRQTLKGNDRLFDEIAVKIAEVQQNNPDKMPLGLELQLMELSGGTGNVREAIESMITKQVYEQQKLDQMLTEFVNKGFSNKYGQVIQHNRMMDNISAAIGSQTIDRTSLPRLFDAYLQENSIGSLNKLLDGIVQTNARVNVVNEKNVEHLVDRYNNFMENQKAFHAENRTTIAKRLGILDSQNEIIPRASQLIKEGKLKELLRSRLISDEVRNDPKTHDDLLFLDNIMRNSVGAEKVKITEKWNAEGDKRVAIREWISKDDNTEFKTPQFNLIESMQEQGSYKLVKLDRSAIINGRKYGDVSRLDGKSGRPNIREIVEANRLIDQPEQRYIDKMVSMGLDYDYATYLKNRGWMSEPDSYMQYIEMSLGSPYIFVSSPRSRKAVNDQYKKWYKGVSKDLEIQVSKLGKDIVPNFKNVFNPDKVKDIEIKLRAMYLEGMNRDAFNNLFTREALQNFTNSGGHNDLGMKLLKYTKLGEGGSWKQTPMKEDLRRLITDLPNLNTTSKESMQNILRDLESDTQGYRVGFYSDEAATKQIKVVNKETGATETVVEPNALIVRNIIKRSVDNIKDEGLREHVKQRYSTAEEGGEGRFTNTLDKSAIDGAIFIDTDTKNLFKAQMNAGEESNGFKGSIAKSYNGFKGNNLNTGISRFKPEEFIHIYGKGLFIYNPRYAASMESKGVRMLVPESAGKNFSGGSLDGQAPIKGRIMEGTSFSADILNLKPGNIMKLNDLDGIGLRFAGHLGNNAVVPHPWTHYQPKDLVIGITEGLQSFQQIINSASEFSNALKRSANIELAEHFNKFKKENGYLNEVGIESFTDFMLSVGGNTRNKVIRDGILRDWEQQVMPALIRPKNAKVSYEFMTPDLRAEVPLAIDVVRPKSGKESGPEDFVSGVRIQMGEASINESAKYMPVHNIKDLLFSFRSGDIDYIVKPRGKNEVDVFTPLREYIDNGYGSKVIRGNRIEPRYENRTYTLKELKGKRKLSSVIEYIEQLNSLHTGKFKDKKIQNEFDLFAKDYVEMRDGLSPNTLTLNNYSINRILERMMEFNSSMKPLKDMRFGLVGLYERGPRKGRSDFMLARIRQRTKKEIELGEEGTMVGLNPHDTHANAQGDHDGDKARWTMFFGDIKDNNALSKLAKQNYRDAAVQEEYPTLPIPPRETNIFGIEMDRSRGVTHAGMRGNTLTEAKSQIMTDQMALGRVVKFQGALEWMYLTDFSIGGKNISKTIGFDVNQIANHGNINRRMEKANQSIQDYIKNVNPALKGDNLFDYFWHGKGEKDFTGKIFEGVEPGSVMSNAIEVTAEILGSPNKLFNQIHDVQGSRSATSYDVQREYYALRKFLSNPNAVVFRQLLNKYRRQGVLRSKIGELSEVFFKGDTNLTLRDRNDIAQGILSGKITPRKDVIKFGNISVDKMIQSSNVGKYMHEMVTKEMFRNSEIDNAYSDVKNMGDIKVNSDLFLDELATFRALGLDPNSNDGFNQLSANEQVFSFNQGAGRNSLKNIEHASLMHQIYSEGIRSANRNLDKALMFKNTPESEILKYSREIDNLERAQTFIENVRTAEVIKNVNEATDTNIKNHTRARAIFNNDFKPSYVYRILGPLQIDGNPNFKALKFETVVEGKLGKTPGRSQNLTGRFIVLKNPIVSTRISKEKAIDGLSWHYTNNSMPLWANKTAFKKYLQFADMTRSQMKQGWRDALSQFRTSRAVEPWSQEKRNRRLQLDNYFRYKDANGVVLDKAGIKELTKRGEDGSQVFDYDKAMVYYKAKMLLTPEPVTRHIIKGDKVPAELPYLSLNERVFKGVFEYLQETGNKDVASLLIKEYNSTRDYLSGLTMDATYDLLPSPQYARNIALPDNFSESALTTLLSRPLDVSMKAFVDKNGIGVYTGGLRGTGTRDGGVRKVVKLLGKWKEASKRPERCK